MLSRSLLVRSSWVLRPGFVVPIGRPFHTSSVLCTPSFKDVVKEATKDVGDTSPEHIKEASSERHEALGGASLGTATGRIADEKSGSTPGYTPNVPNPHNPNPQTKATQKPFAPAGTPRDSPKPASSAASGSRTTGNATNYNPTPGTASGTGSVPGEPGATRPIPSAPGSPSGASASRTADTKKK